MELLPVNLSAIVFVALSEHLMALSLCSFSDF